MKPKHHYLETIKVITNLFYKSKKYFTGRKTIYEYDFYLELHHKESSELTNLFKANEYLKDLIIESIKHELREGYGGKFVYSKFLTEIVNTGINETVILNSIKDNGFGVTVYPGGKSKEISMKQLSTYGLYKTLVLLIGNA